MSQRTQDMEAELEDWVDTSSLADVLGALRDICYGKAEHLRSNWQDRSMARVWERLGARIGTVSTAALDANL